MLPYIITLSLVAIVCAVVAAVHRSRKSKVVTGEYSFDYSALITFLEKADDAYILTHETMDIMLFSKFASSRVCNDLIEFLYRNPPKMFGSRKHRQRNWNIIEYSQHEISIKKTIMHRHVEIKRGMKIKLGDDMVEYWDIAITSGGFRIHAINADSALEEEVY
ncbi:hypothetical protein [Paenibacillus sinopodophylli]|uniref:hypothetical protein n=1 Tax=Paenibacillus sinopodophylli TaxID=1837342 RepID=UPI00110CE42C|nr:hypothetical protein [Paenibacillus sinopodophylli]